MSNLRKSFVVVAIVLLAVVLSVAVMGCEKDKTDGVQLVKLSDITIPAHVDTEKLFGLFFLDREGNLYRSTAEQTANSFDPNKPTIIFAHGMQFNTGYEKIEELQGYEKWIDAGYNLGLWQWGQFSDCNMPTTGTDLIWTRDLGTFYYKDENGKRVRETEDVLKYSTAEVFVAYWLDFINKIDYKGSEIIFSGHSLGASTMFAVSDYMFKLNESGLIGKEVLPDRLVFMDAYMDAIYTKVGDNEATKDIPWLTEEETAGLKDGGVIARAKAVAAKARDLGISAEFIQSSAFSRLSDLTVYGISDSLFNSFTTVYLDTKGIADTAQAHNTSVWWYIDTISTDTMYDDSDPSGRMLGIDAKTPNSVSYARFYNKTPFYHDDGGTPRKYSDDSMASDGVGAPIVAGFAFFDENDNGINDDRLYNRVNGVKVELYENDVKINETTTLGSGYYQFTLASDYAGKNYRIVVSGTEIGKVSDGGYMSNGVNADGSSAVWTPTSDVDLKIINIGVKK